MRRRLLAGILEPILKRLTMAMGEFQGWMEALYGRVAHWMIVKGLGLALKLSRLVLGFLLKLLRQIQLN
ncbi:MAG: hypothetical protein QXH67_00680 [Candidatus Bathyarchaeia archaeon]